MPSIRLPEKLGALTKTSSTTVSLAASRINLGGQQYVTSALTLSSAVSGAGGLDTGSLSVDQLWYVHAVVVNGVVSLLASLSKTAPTGFTNFKWTGWAFVTNDANTITQCVKSTTWDWQSYTPSWTSDGTQPQLNNGQAIGSWRRLGDSIQVRVGIISGNTTAYGSGSYFFSLPPGIAIDTSKVINTTTQRGPLGTGFYIQLPGGTNHWYLLMAAYASTTTFCLLVDNADVNSTAIAGASQPVVPPASTAGNEWRSDIVLPIAGWSSTDL